MDFRRIFSKHYTHSNKQLNKVCILWNCTECWASSRSNGFQRKFLKHYTHSKIQLNNLCALWKFTAWWASSRSNGFQKIFFQNIIHIQTYNWTMYALCKGTLSGGLQPEAMASRRSFLKHYTHSNIHLNKICALWKYSEWWASSRSNGFQKKFFETLCTFKPTIEQSMRSVKVQWVVGFKQKQWVSEVFQNIIHIQTYNWTMYALCQSSLSGGIQAEAMARRRSFLKHYAHSNLQLNKVCPLWKYSEWWASSRSNGFQKNFFKTLCIFKHTIEQCMHSVKVHWVVGFKQEQWLAEDFFSKQYTYSNIQLNNVCAL